MAGTLNQRLAFAFIGGCLGGALRIAVGLLWHGSDGVPWPLLVINLVGSFAIGVVGVLWGGHARWWPLLGPGLLGGFTTFSGIAAMTWTTSASTGQSIAVLAGSLVACTVAARVGVTIGERIGQSR